MPRERLTDELFDEVRLTGAPALFYCWACIVFGQASHVHLQGMLQAVRDCLPLLAIGRTGMGSGGQQMIRSLVDGCCVCLLWHVHGRRRFVVYSVVDLHLAKQTQIDDNDDDVRSKEVCSTHIAQHIHHPPSLRHSKAKHTTPSPSANYCRAISIAYISTYHPNPTRPTQAKRRAVPLPFTLPLKSPNPTADPLLSDRRARVRFRFRSRTRPFQPVHGRAAAARPLRA